MSAMLRRLVVIPGGPLAIAASLTRGPAWIGASRTIGPESTQTLWAAEVPA